MGSDPLSDSKIIDSWAKNAAPWTTAVRNGDIESRRLVTDQAIIDAILSRSPHVVLDLGCGEGWLARALATHGIRVVGVDVVPGLIEQAQQGGGGDFHVISYEEITAGELELSADVVVCNFSLLGKESVEGIFNVAHSLLRPGGAFIVQTLHPFIANGDAPYQDGWRPGTWAGFSSDFVEPAPWYFRTLKSWVKLFTASGLTLLDVREPLHPVTAKPASALFIAVAPER